MDFASYLLSDTFLKLSALLFSWVLVLVSFSTQRLLAAKAPSAGQAWRLFLLGVLCIAISISTGWWGLLDQIRFLSFLPIVKVLKLIGVTALSIGLYNFVRES